MSFSDHLPMSDFEPTFHYPSNDEPMTGDGQLTMPSSGNATQPNTSLAAQLGNMSVNDGSGVVHNGNYLYNMDPRAFYNVSELMRAAAKTNTH
jgi:hypothetical protein